VFVIISYFQTYYYQKKNSKWGKTSVDDQDLTARVLSTEETTDEEL